MSCNLFSESLLLRIALICCNKSISECQCPPEGGYQWQIQPTLPVGRGAPTYDFTKFSPKLHEIERIWTGGGASKILLCRSTTEYLLTWLKKHVDVHFSYSCCVAFTCSL